MKLLIESRVTLKQFESGGTIDLVMTPAGPVLQFNCSCLDALPFCKGMCCGNRQLYNTNLTEKESKRFLSFTAEKRPGEFFLMYDPGDRKCVYQNKTDGTCFIHNDKPRECNVWHCSPGGVGLNLLKKDQGWFMTPIMMAMTIEHGHVPESCPS